MDYKPGDKFIVEISGVYEATDGVKGDRPFSLYRMKHFNTLTFDEVGLSKLEPFKGDDYAYERGVGDGKREIYDAIKTRKCRLISDESYEKDLAAAEDLAYKKALKDFQKQHENGYWLTEQEYKELTEKASRHDKAEKIEKEEKEKKDEYRKLLKDTFGPLGLDIIFNDF